MLSPRALSLATLSWLIQFPVCLTTARATGGDWPKGYEIAENSESADGRFGVLLPTRDTADADEDKIPNTLVDLEKHRRLGVIRGAHYFPGENHRGLQVTWVADSSWCAVVYEDRYGFGKITLVEPRGTTCTQTDLGLHIQEALDGVIARQAHGTSAGGYGNAHFRSAPGRKILVRATGYTNPKSFADQPTYYALFQGTFDLAKGKRAADRLAEATRSRRFHRQEMQTHGRTPSRNCANSSGKLRCPDRQRLIPFPFCAKLWGL